MRNFQGGWLLTVVAVLCPAMAWAGNQETAEQIARQLQQSGQLHHFRIQVKYQDGTAWLQGQVADQQQAAAALRLALSSPGVERVVNQLEVQSPASADSQALVASQAAYQQPMPYPGASYQQPMAYPAGSYPQRMAYPAMPLPSQPPAQQASSAPFSGLSRRVQGLLGTKKPTPEMQTYRGSPQAVRPVAAYQPMGNAPGQLAPMTGAAPLPIAAGQGEMGVPGGPLPMYTAGMGGQTAPVRYDQPYLPNYAWPSYAAYPNYAALTYPKQYSPTAWPYIGPFYPYPQVPLGWRRVTLEWDDGWWFLDFKDTPRWGDTPISSWR